MNRLVAFREGSQEGKAGTARCGTPTIALQRNVYLAYYDMT